MRSMLHVGVMGLNQAIAACTCHRRAQPIIKYCLSSVSVILCGPLV